MAKDKKQDHQKGAGKKVEETLHGAQRIIADGAGIKQEDGNADLSPEQQAIETMGKKTKQGVSTIVGEGKKVVKGAINRHENKKFPAEARESRTENVPPESPAPEPPQDTVHSEPIKKPPVPAEGAGLSLLDRQDNPQTHQEAGLNQISGNLDEKLEDIKNKGNIQRSEGAPEPVRPIPPRQPANGGAELQVLEISSLDTQQEFSLEILPDRVDLQTGQIARRDIEIKEDDEVSIQEAPKSGTGSTEQAPTELPVQPQRQEPEPSTGSREQGIRPQPRRGYQEEKNGSENIKSQPSKERRDENNRMGVKSREADRSTLKVGGNSPITTSENTAATYGIQSQTASLATISEGGGQAIKTIGQEAGQAASQAGTSAATGAATGGVSVAVQVGEKVVEKIKETIQTAVQTVKESPKAIGGVAAMFFVPIIAVVVLASTFGSNGGSASNQNLSEGVLALMSKIIAACQEHGIPEYAPLVAAVMMQESGGNVELVNGDVMMCAEAMGYPVFTPVPVDESISYGTGLIADLLEQAGAQGPDDLQNIKLALQSYNYGPGYMSWVKTNHGGKYSKENAIEFANMMAAQMGWSGYGDEEYVDHVLRYYRVDSFGILTGDSVIENGFFAYPCSDHTWDTYYEHEGIDISWGGCFGEPIYAVADGVVTYTHDGWTPAEGIDGIRSYGNTAWVFHSNGWQSRYGHMSSVAVESGTHVTQGQLLGYIGSTGNSSGAHLHLALYDPSGNPFSGSQNWAEVAWPQHGG